jgi:voltage-gated potassium channel
MSDQTSVAPTEEELRLEEEKATRNNSIGIVIGGGLLLIAIGVNFYHYVEGFTWLNSLWFCIESLSTVGYGDLVPHTSIGKIFTIFFIFAGVTVFVRSAQLVSDAFAAGRRARIARRVARRKAHHEAMNKKG